MSFFIIEKIFKKTPVMEYLTGKVVGCRSGFENNNKNYPLF